MYIQYRNYFLSLSVSDLDFDDDDEWQRMQEGVEKMEKVLDTISKTSHDVHAPFFPEVSDDVMLFLKT